MIINYFTYKNFISLYEIVFIIYFISLVLFFLLSINNIFFLIIYSISNRESYNIYIEN